MMFHIPDWEWITFVKSSYIYVHFDTWFYFEYSCTMTQNLNILFKKIRNFNRKWKIIMWVKNSTICFFYKSTKLVHILLEFSH